MAASGWLRGKVKAVTSGDCLLIMGSTKAEIPPEKSITLSYLMAPRLARRNGVDEPFAWESREFLRKLCIGKEVTFRVDSTAPNIGREFGTVYLGDKNVAYLVVAAGWARVKEQGPKGGEQSPYLAELQRLEEVAKQQGLGRWSKEIGAAEESIRDLPPSAIGESSGFDAKGFAVANKGNSLEAIVEQVRDGSTVRVYLLPSFQFVQIYVAGVQAPSMGRRPQNPTIVAEVEGTADGTTNGDDSGETPAPLTTAQRLAASAVSTEVPADRFGREAKHFTETRVLNRDVRIVVEGTDSFNNIIGSVYYPDGETAKDLSLELVENGLAKYVEWSANMLDVEIKVKLKNAELQAKKEQLRIWTGFKPPVTNSKPIHDQKFTGKVVEVVSGDCIIVADDAAPYGSPSAERRVNLSSIRAPKLGNPRREDNKPETFARESKEFLRTRLIGKQVTVEMEYSRRISTVDGQNAVPATNMADTKVLDYGSVFLGSPLQAGGDDTSIPSTGDQPRVNVAELLLSRGFAEISKHRDYEERSHYFDALLAAHSRAEKSKKGVHSAKLSPVMHITDLTQVSAKKAKDFLPFLQRNRRQAAIVEYVFSGHRFKLTIPKETCSIAFSLSGVRCPGRDEPYSSEAIALMRRMILQRDVEIEVETVDRNGTFLGSLWESKTNISSVLLEAGLAKLSSFGLDRIPDAHVLTKAEQSAKQKKLKTLMSGSTDNFPIHKGTYGATFDSFSSDQSSKPHSLAYQHLKEMTNSFSAERVLRSSIFGVVYKGVRENGELIAVKKLVASRPGFHRDFEIECNHLMKLKHPNVVRVLGYSYETHKICLESKTGSKSIFVEMTERLLCSEYLPKGSLDMYLSDESSGYDWQARYKIILGICNGLDYLQEGTDHQPIIHLDLKPTNILFDDNMIPKITDFGISRLFHQEQTMNTLDTNETLYMAPEYVHGGAITLKSDIFSLGVILLEVITGQRGFHGVISSGDFIDLEDEILKTTLEKAQLHALSEIDCQGIKRCIQIGIICLNVQKTKRPTIKNILKMLHGLEKSDCHYSDETEMSSLPHVTSPTETPTSLGVTAPLLRKLDSLFPPEYRVPKPLADDMDLLKKNLEEISAALFEQSMVDVPNKMAKLWMSEARDLSYDIEEFIDNMMQKWRVRDPGQRGKMRKKPRRKLRCAQYHRVGHVKIPSFAWLPKALKPSAKIAEFRSLLQEASDRYYRYLDGCTTSSGCVISAHGKDPVLYANAANYLVGINDTKSKLVKWLTNREQQQLKVVPIVGPAGVGKTTLAKQVYRELGMHFECRAFVQASRKPDMRRLLVGILSQVQRCPGVSGSCSVQDLIDNLNEYLQDKRYIIVIDDLWETTTRDILASAFPESNNRSRIIITAEFESVALGYCDYESNNIFRMKPLGSKDSGNLFFKLVFGPEIQCPERLKDVSDMIIAKCSGLPLATICIAGLLASQRDNSELWQHVQQYLCSSLNTNSSLEETLQEVLKFSYNSIPYYLKTCLMYIGMHPEGHTIWKVDLVNQWIAEDFISATEGKNTGEVAESYFSELVDRGLIQPVEIMYNGSVLSCTVNHVLLDLIAPESSEDKLITTVDYSQTITELYSSARRLSLNFSNARYATKPKSLTLSKVRSFAFFGIIKCMPSIVELKQLRVLILKFWGDHPESMIFDLTEICLLFQLRYLKISCTADVEVKLPTEMQSLRYMETLVVDASVSAVPSDIIHLPVCLRTLHYIDSGSYYEGNVFSLGELKNLQDLHITYYTEKLDEHQKRNLTAVTGLSSSIGKLVNLKSFTLSPGASDMAVYHDFSSSMSCPSVFLQSLQLLPPICIFTTLPGWLGQLRNLCTLEVAVYQLLIEDMDMLAGLSALTSLSLYVWQITTGPIVFKRGAFPAVKYFKYTCSLLSLAFQEEAFPSLQRLELSFNAHRGKEYDYFLDGIEYIISLKEIAGTIGTTGGAEKPDRIAAKSAFDDAFRKHPSFPSYNIVNIADWVEEDLSDEHSRILGKATKEDTRRFWNPYFYVTSELEHFQSFGF